MAQRPSEKPKRPAAARTMKAAPAAKNVAGGTGAPASLDLETRLKACEQERDRLAAALVAAEARIAKLEDARAQVINRIDWVIDSLHNVIEGEA